MRLSEFAPARGGNSGDYLKALASAWYNGVYDTGSLPRGIKTQEDVERLLNRGIVCPDGKTRKLHIDYNSDFDGVVIYSDDYYEHGDLDGNDGRTGQPFGPYDHMEFAGDELDEGLNEFAPPGGDDREPDEEEILRQLAAQWWRGDEDPRAERTLASMGWEIGQDEGYDNGGVFVVRAGDINGRSYISWSAEELDELEEGWKSALGGAALAGAMALGGGAAGAKMMPATGMQAPAATTAQSTAPVAAQPTLRQQASPVDQLKAAAMASGIKGTELAQFLAQCAHESANFASMEERGSPAYFAKKYEQNPRKARILGNKVKGDGERFKGRGFIQLTGRDNYTRAGAALGLPLAQQPDLAARPDIAAKVAVWYWQNRVAPKIKDFSNTGDVTKKINPGQKGLQSRQDQFKSYQVAMR